jgi:RimJ/RimL family protein N-acetyltransferase
METPINVMIAQSQSEIMAGKFVPHLPQGINEFLYELNATMGQSNRQVNYEDMSNMYGKMLKIASRSEADIIADLHKAVYRNNYPYHEMLDSSYLGDLFGDQHNGSCYLYGCKEKPIAGCGMMLVDNKDRIGYMRGLMVLPEFQGKFDIKSSVLASVAYGYSRYKQNVDKWYTETRSAHSKAQYLMESVGLRPCGIFPNKDVFFGGTKRESDVLEVGFFEDTLFTLRNPEPKILPQLADLFEYTSERFMLQSDIDYQESQISIDNAFMSEAIAASKLVSVFKNDGEFNTVDYKFTTPNGSMMKFMVTKTVSAAEKAEIKMLDPMNYVDLTAILLKLKQVVVQDDLQYFEIYLPATDPTVQSIFLQLDFSVFGYVPAWKQNEEGSLDDCIVFGIYRTPIDESEIKLTAFGKDFLSVLTPFLKCGIF